MDCPICHGRVLKVAVTFTGEVACRFSADGDFQIVDAVDLDSSLQHDAAVSCPACGWTGTFQQTRRTAAGTAGPLPQPMTAEEFDSLMTEVKQLPGNSRRVAERLAGEVRRLNMLLDSLSRFPSDGPQDTAIG